MNARMAEATAGAAVNCTTCRCPGTFTNDPLGARDRNFRHHSVPAIGSFPPRITRSGASISGTRSSIGYAIMCRSCVKNQAGPHRR